MMAYGEYSPLLFDLMGVRNGFTPSPWVTAGPAAALVASEPCCSSSGYVPNQGHCGNLQVM